MTTDAPPLEEPRRVIAAPAPRPEGEPGPPRPPEPDERDGDDGIDRSARVPIAVAFPIVAAAVMLGGIFTGIAARSYGAIAGLLGLGLALVLARVRRPVVANILVLGGLFAIGLVMVLPSGPDGLFDLGESVGRARAAGDVLRPPVDLDPGWQAILGWIMGMVGFTAGWVAVVLRRPSTAMLVPLPIAAIAGISVPEDQQIASGVVVLALFALGLGLLSGGVGSGDGQRPSVAFEVRRAVRSIPLVAVITVALVFLAQADFLFPAPVIDPTREPQRPKTVPLTEVEDRVLFEVRDPEGDDLTVTGPWRIGSLDVYDGTSWLLPPFAENELDAVPAEGIVDEELRAGVGVTFRIRGLSGAVLPVLANPVGIIASGPKLAYDARNSNIRTAEGQIEPDLEYTVTAAALPSVADLQRVVGEIPPGIVMFTAIPPPPPGIAALIETAPTTSKWDAFDFLRLHVLDNVTVSGPGIPIEVTPERVEEMLTDSLEGSPYEIVAAQAMLARWIDVPARIGYGFDGGEEIDGGLAVRPRHGASFVEVYFPGFKWLPVIGTPRNAKPSVGSEGELNFDPSVLPSDEISVQLFLPVVVPPGSVLVKQIRLIVLITVPSILLLLALYFTYPALAKASKRNRRRRAAVRAGPHARVALAYAEWRDHATDLGYRYGTDTPLMFLHRFADDEEHHEFAWLTTRVLWGDLAHGPDPGVAAAAEELSRALRRRLSQAHPVSLRLVAAVSRLSLRDPYAPLSDLTRRPPRRPDREVAEPRELVSTK